MNKNVIEINDLWVSYPMQEQMGILNLFTRKRERYWALKNLNFNVKKGEILGVIGGNGAGKSTLLKLLAGLISHDRGEIKTIGEKPVLLTLGTGFQNELTGIQNIYLNGLMLGFTKEQIDDQLEEIIEFSELGEFIYKPVRVYSSGMKARLGFSIAITLDPEVLLLDEILGVGDIAFREKCRERIYNKIYDNRTVVLVTHSIGLLKKLCHRAVWLHKGEQMAVGPTETIASEYSDFMKTNK